MASIVVAVLLRHIVESNNYRHTEGGGIVSVQAVVEKLEGVKEFVGRAPYEAVAAGLATFIVTGLDEVQTTVERILAALPDTVHGASEVRKTAEVGGQLTATIATVPGETPNPTIDAAIGSLGEMGSRAELVRAGLEGMDENLRTALGHLAAFRTCMDQHHGAIETAQENLTESVTASDVALDQITTYQVQIS